MSTQSSKAFLAKKNTTCGTCKKTYYATLGACPFCVNGQAILAPGLKPDPKNATCFTCRRSYYKTLGACPFCPAGGRAEAPLAPSTEDEIAGDASEENDEI